MSLRQSVIPPRLLGRVNSGYRFVGWGTMPIGAAIGGLIAHFYGLRAPFYFAAAIVAAAALLALSQVTQSAIDAAHAEAELVPVAAD